MSEQKKLCGLVLPYFGKFNNYFQLFLNSCGENPSYEWLVFTDCREPYRYPSNVKVVYTTLQQVEQTAKEKIGPFVKLQRPYKLCDFRPAYGVLFEEYLADYRYWGFCDCDLLFGDLEKMLTPLLEQGYDKLFAAGHLTLIRNTEENNRRFLADSHGESLYRIAMTSDKSCNFDEDFKGCRNIHDMFLEQGAKVYTGDLSMNPSLFVSKFVRESYSHEARTFVRQPYVRARYYWHQGTVLGLEVRGRELIPHEYLYIHLQHRKMRVPEGTDSAGTIEVLPDRFRPKKVLPQKVSQMQRLTIGWPYTYGIRFHGRRLRNKVSGSIRKVLRKFGVKC